MNGHYQEGDVVLHNWVLKRKIGEGSYGRVFEAVREDYGITYRSAIKIITIPQVSSEITSAKAEGMDDVSITSYFRGFVEELMREIALMASLKGSSNIVSYEDHAVVEHTEGIGWDIIIRMELLTPLLEQGTIRAMATDEVVKLGKDICRALELCHEQQILHRDVKPENIFISSRGDYKLGDFGIARTVEKTTGGLSKKGTYTYMAPEVYKGEAYGSTVDLFSLGIVLYRLLNKNRAPFLPPYPAPITHGDREAALARQLRGDPLPPIDGVSEELQAIIRKASAYDPKERYATAKEMREALEKLNLNEAETPSQPEQKEEEKTVNAFGIMPEVPNAPEEASGFFAAEAEVEAEQPASVFDMTPEAPNEPEEEKTVSIFGATEVPAVPEEQPATVLDATVSEVAETSNFFSAPEEEEEKTVSIFGASEVPAVPEEKPASTFDETVGVFGNNPVSVAPYETGSVATATPTKPVTATKPVAPKKPAAPKKRSKRRRTWLIIGIIASALVHIIIRAIIAFGMS